MGNSTAAPKRLSSPGWKARPKLRLRLLANLQELRLWRKPMMFLGQMFPSSSLPWSTKPRTQRIHKLRGLSRSWRIGVARKRKSKYRSAWAYIYIYLSIVLQRCNQLDPYMFCWVCIQVLTSTSIYIFIMKLLNSNMHGTHSVFIISAIAALALQKYNSMSADEKRALWPSTLLEVGSRATFSRCSPVWSPANPLRRSPLKLLKDTCL